MPFDLSGRALAAIFAGALVSAGALSTACSADAPSGDAALSKDEARVLFGDDRIADVLATSFDRVPRSYAEFERLFQVGRECPRSDSKEMYVVEEPSTRLGGVQRATPTPVPRGVVTGCNTEPTSAGGERRSYELFVALISAPEAPRASEGDTLVLDQVEAMALDRATGLYSFYILSPQGSPGAVQRIEMGADGVVREHTKEPGKPLVTKDAGKRCFNCHANGDPIMNELTDPWTSWVSPRQRQASVSGLSGETLAIVSEASAPATVHARSSFANSLEVSVRHALRDLALGGDATATTTAPQGLGRAVLAGKQPGGVTRLLRSTFCETTLNYLSATADAIPIELFVDPAVFAGERFDRPRGVAGNSFPRLLPVRGELDKRIEELLVRERYLTPELALAVRLVDDKNDVFSDARCELLAEISTGLRPDADAAAVSTRVRDVLAQRVAAGLLPAGARRAYVEALLDPSASEATRSAARAAYVGEAKKALEDDVAKLASTQTRADFEERLERRHAAARALFPGDANPLPVFRAHPVPRPE